MVRRYQLRVSIGAYGLNWDEIAEVLVTPPVWPLEAFKKATAIVVSLAVYIDEAGIDF
jgi:hypothetical protein